MITVIEFTILLLQLFLLGCQIATKKKVVATTKAERKRIWSKSRDDLLFESIIENNRLKQQVEDLTCKIKELDTISTFYDHFDVKVDHPPSPKLRSNPLSGSAPVISPSSNCLPSGLLVPDDLLCSP